MILKEEISANSIQHKKNYIELERDKTESTFQRTLQNVIEQMTF